MTHGSEKRKREKHLTFRLSSEERSAIDAAAEAAGLTPGSYARQILFGAPQPRSVRRRVADHAVLARLLGQAGKIGSNLNQLARASNGGAAVCEAELLEALDGLHDVRFELLAALGKSP